MNSYLSNLLTESSPSPMDLSQEDYLDIIYGPKRAVIIDDPNPGADISLRMFGSRLPQGTLIYSTIPIKIEGVDVNRLTRKAARKNFDWSYASVAFRTDEGLEGIVRDIVEQTLPAFSAISVGGRLLEVGFRIDADSEKKWKEETQKLRAEFGNLTVIPDPLIWAAPSFLPSQSAGVSLLYFNPGLTE